MAEMHDAADSRRRIPAGTCHREGGKGQGGKEGNSMDLQSFFYGFLAALLPCGLIIMALLLVAHDRARQADQNGFLRGRYHSLSHDHYQVLWPAFKSRLPRGAISRQIVREARTMKVGRN